MIKILSYADRRKTNLPYIEESYDTYEGEPFPRELVKFGDYKSFNVKKENVSEILAPATKSSYKLAIYSGADAIYFGYKEFNARAGADNFDSIKEVVDFCHFYKVKAYLALNICFKDNELSRVNDIIDEAERANIDAIIICDLALVPYIKNKTHAAIHASTQMGIHNTWGINFARDMEFNRAVLSREMNYRDIINTTDSQSVETEVFVHGALCSCFSGGCLLSSMLTGNSANRGKCNQLCRRFYRATVDGKQTVKGYLLSAKDNCLAKQVGKIVDVGVGSIKIEGRLKRPEYVGAVTNFYRDIMDGKHTRFDINDIKLLFNRGNFTEGYFNGANNVIYTGQPNHIGVYAGRVIHVIGNNKAYVKSEKPLDPDNGYKILRNTTEIGGAIATGERIRDFSVIKSNSMLKEGDIIRLTNDAILAECALSIKKKKNVPIRIRIAGGERPIIVMNIKGNRYRFVWDQYVPEAINHPLTEEEIRDLFEGNRAREVQFIIIELQLYNAFLTKAQLNQLRRAALDCVWKFLLGYYDKPSRYFGNDPMYKSLPEVSQKIEGDFCEVNSVEQAKIVSKKICNIIYNPPIYKKDECELFYKKIKNDKNRIFIKIPIYVPTTKEEFFEDIVRIFDGVLANNVGVVYLAQDMKKLLVCGPNLNITNTKNWLINNSCSYVVSTELKYSEVKKFKNPLVYTYGYLPLMHLNFCPRRLAGLDCDDCNHEVRYCDEKGEYLIDTQKFDGYCEHVLRNAVKTDIGNIYDGIRFYFDFCCSDTNEIKKILSLYYSTEEYKPIDTNKLHLSRGIE